MGRVTGQLEALKSGNLCKLFRILSAERTVSRPELARRSQLSSTTIGGLTDELVRLGLAQQVGYAESSGGRPAALLQFNPGARIALGAHLADHQWSVVATDLDAHIVERVEVRTADDSADAAVSALCDGVRAITSLVGGVPVLPAIGLGTPGLVDARSGVIKTAVDVGWADVPIAQMVRERLGWLVFVANRSKVGALAELTHGVGRDISDLIYVSIGSGIAAGIVHERRLYLGANSSAGELGHVTVLPDGPLCRCGNRGCLQQLASGPAIADMARARLRGSTNSSLHEAAGAYPERITATTVFEAAERGDGLALDIVHEVATYLGIAIANMVNLFNPELIVLGGSVGRSAQVLVEPLQAAVRQRAMAYPLSATRIVASTLGPDSGAIGSASMVLQEACSLIFGAG